MTPTNWGAKKLTLDEREKALSTALETVEAAAATRQQLLLRFARLYENVAVTEFDPSDMASAFFDGNSSGNSLSYNVIQMCVDALNAKITKNSPRPMFLTSGGRWPDQMKARKLDRWCRGVFAATKMYKVARRVRADASIFGDGFLHLRMNDAKKLVAERVSPMDLRFDPAHIPSEKLNTVYRRTFIPTDELTHRYPEKAALSKTMSLQDTMRSWTLDGNVTVVWECWTLGFDKLPGRYARYAPAFGLLESSEWKPKCLPFVHVKHHERVAGPFGKGLAETLLGTQVELNRICNSIVRQFQRKGKGRTFVQKGTVNLRHLTNAEADIVEYAGSTPPIVDAGNTIPVEDHQHVRELVERAQKLSGLSEMSVSAKKPAGLDAAVALREYSDLESERFATQHKDWDDFFLAIAELAVELVRHTPGGYKVKVPGRRTTEEIDWADVNLEEDAYVMQMFPTSALPQTPAARKAQVIELRDAGMVSPDAAKRLLDFPDIEAEMTLGTAQIDDVDATISAILDKDTPEYMAPEVTQNLPLLAERSLMSYLQVRHFKDIEPSRLELLLRLIDETTLLIQQSQPPPPPQPTQQPVAA